jgi:hypothetical protein
MGNADPAIALLRRRSTTEDTAMKKIVFAVCCATLMGLGTAMAQTSAAPAQDTTSKSTSMSKEGMSKGKMAKSKATKHKTVGMSKSSKAKSDSMTKGNMPK